MFGRFATALLGLNELFGGATFALESSRFSNNDHIYFGARMLVIM